MRLIEFLTGRTKEAVGELAALRLDGYDADDVGQVVRNVAALWERMLKASDQTWYSGDASLFAMTNVLGDRGWPAAADLHVVRSMANADKHDPYAEHDLEQLLASLERIGGELGDLTELVPGLAADLPERMRRRRMVCAIYEFFAHGETQYSFLAARDDDTWLTAREVDSFQVENRHTTQIEEELAQFDGWVVDPPELENLKKSLAESDHEFWQVAMFTASYQDVLDLMAPFQHALPLLGGLHREDRDHNVIASVVAAQITGRVEVGTTPRSAARVADIHARVSAVLALVPGGLIGLRLDRCGLETFTRSMGSAVVVDEELGLLVTSAGVVLVLQ